jgi:hypothetical protein
VGSRPSADGAHDATLDQKCEARARAWRFVFECYERKKAGASGAARTGEEEKGESDDEPQNTVRP